MIDNTPNEVNNMYREHRELIKEQHIQMHISNTNILDNSGIDYTKASHECYVFRGPRNADFYPSTGRWRDIDKRYTKNGGATLFLKWLNK